MIVAGGGAAGMFAAALLAEKGISVTIIEHNEKLGKKTVYHGERTMQLYQRVHDRRVPWTDSQQPEVHVQRRQCIPSLHDDELV